MCCIQLRNPYNHDNTITLQNITLVQFVHPVLPDQQNKENVFFFCNRGNGALEYLEDTEILPVLLLEWNSHKMLTVHVHLRWSQGVVTDIFSESKLRLLNS